MTILNIIHMLLSILLIVIILIQVRGQGGGLFGSAEGSFRSSQGSGKDLVSVYDIPDRGLSPGLNIERQPKAFEVIQHNLML